MQVAAVVVIKQQVLFQEEQAELAAVAMAPLDHQTG
jgi:hypothetical protein